MAGEIFKLNFVTNGEGVKVIDEPVGFDAADFTLKQKPKGYARDVSFAGGESEFTFYRMRKHEFETLVYYYETYGWESEVQLLIETTTGDSIIGNLDFYEAKTDLLEYFTCKVIQQQKEALVKKRHDVKVNLFNDKDLDDNNIVPVETANTLVLSKPTTQSSEWETPSAYSYRVFAGFRAVFTTDTSYFTFNPCTKLTKYDIEDSLAFLETDITGGEGADNFKIVSLANSASNIKITITNLDFYINAFKEDGGDGYIDFKLELGYGANVSSNKHVFFSKYIEPDSDYSNTNEYSFEIPSLERNDGIWLYFFAKVRQSKSVANILASVKGDVAIKSMDVNISLTSKTYNTVVPSVRLYDAVSQNVKAVSQLPTSFTFAQKGGEMYDQRVLSGNMLRGLIDKPFYFSMKEISEWLPEINGDYEVSDEEVYFGRYPDYYRNVESGVFTSVKFDDYEKTFNKRYAINQFNFGYNKYQSQKENEVENTYDVIHGKSEWILGNVFVENKKEPKISFIRDAFMIAETQKKSLEQSDTTATQDDDNIYILDTIENTENLTFEETDFLQHTYDSSTGKLTLSNEGNFSWVLLGLAPNETFEILGTDPNAGSYSVFEVTSRKLILTKLGAAGVTNGERTTTYKYIVSTATAPYKTWTDEGFSLIDNINNGSNFANLRYSVKRNVKRFWNEYLATANLYVKKAIKNTFYKNNETATLTYEGVTTVESDSFTPTDPILSPNVHKVTVITDFATYKRLENSLRSERGYVRIVDRTDFILKLYPTELKYINSAELGELTITGEEKYVTSYINIIDDGSGILVINDEYITTSLNYVIQNEKFYIFDETQTLLYRPCLWKKITVNGANATSKVELIQWLDLLA